MYYVTIYLNVNSQSSWVQKANIFLANYNTINFSKISSSQIGTLILKTGDIISAATDSLDKEILSQIYTARGDLRVELVYRKTKESITISPEEVSNIEFDFNKAIGFCVTCKCRCLEALRYVYSLDPFVPKDNADIYMYKNSQVKLIETEIEIAALGGTGEWPTFIGIGVEYIAPGNILGADMGFLGGGKVFQKRSVNPKTGKKYRACTYEYPKAVGMLSIGYEKSFDDYNYDAFKANLIWVNAFLSLSPAQFLYAQHKGDKSFVWRPTAGVSFSSLSVNYAFNLPFKKEFNYIPSHMISIRIMLPILNLRDANQ